MGYRYNAITGELDFFDSSSEAGNDITQIDTDAGSASPVLGIVNLLGTAAQGISSSGAGNTVTLTMADATETQKGVSELATDAESIAGADTSRTIVSTSLKAKLGTQTLYGIPYGATDSIAISWSAAMSDGQVLIGATGAAPAPANLASAGGTVTITNGANTINLESGGAVPTSFVADTGVATPALNILNVLGGNNIGTVGAANNLTVNLTGTTNHAVQVGNVSGSLTSLAVGTTGELLIGNTGADPAFGSTAYADFSFANITTVATPRILVVTNTDVNAASHADLRLSTPPLGGDSLVSWEVQGSHFFAAGVDNQVAGDPWKLSNSSHPSAGTAAITVDATTAAVTLASAYEFPIADGTANYVLKTDGAGNLDFAEVGTLAIDHDNILYVGKHGSDANDGKTPSLAKLTIQAAVTAAVAGDTILVYPGTYTETITHAANNVAVLAQGKPSNCIITQADANVIDFNTRSGILYKNFGISCTAATTAINTIEGTTGSCVIRDCQTSMVSAADIAAIVQPSIGEVSGAGELSIRFGQHTYTHTGNGGGTANKAAFRVGTGGSVHLDYIHTLTISNSGTALVTATGIDTNTTGVFEIHDCYIEVTDPDAVIVCGLVSLGGTGITNEFFRNEVHVTATNNNGYGFWSADTASLSRFFYNHIHVTDVAGASYSFLIGNTTTVISQFDDIVAEDGYSLTAGGSYTQVNSEIDGDFTCCGATAAGTRNLTVCNRDNTATASNAAVNISVGGATSTGDPYTNYLVTGAGTYSVGIDNSDSDNFKITSGATPSAGTDLFKMTSAGVITLNNDLDVSEGGTGVSTLTSHGILMGNGAGDIQATAEPSNGQILIGKTGDFPQLATLTDGNNITFTEGAGTITANLTDTTQYAVQVGDATGSLDSLALGTATQVLTSNGAGANPSWQDAAGGVTWTAVTEDTDFTVNTGTIANKAGLLTMTLPAAAAIGDIIEITGINTAVGWRIAQNANQQMHCVGVSTTAGVGGYLEATSIRDSAKLMCVVAGASTEYNVISSTGNITIV